MAKEIESNCMIGIVGNKYDLFLEEEVSENEGKNFAKAKGYKFKLVSAKTDPNSFNAFLEELIQDYYELNNNDNTKSNNVSLNESNFYNEEGRKSNCCGQKKKR